MKKNIVTTIGFILFLVAIVYGSWMLKRTINYRWFYQDQVQSEIQKAVAPLEERITQLEFQIKTNR